MLLTTIVVGSCGVGARSVFAGNGRTDVDIAMRLSGMGPSGLLMHAFCGAAIRMNPYSLVGGFYMEAQASRHRLGLALRG